MLDQLKEIPQANVPKQAQQPVIDAFEEAGHLQERFWRQVTVGGPLSPRTSRSLGQPNLSIALSATFP